MYFKKKLNQAQKEVLKYAGKPGLERDLQSSMNRRALYAYEFESIAKEIGVRIEL